MATRPAAANKAPAKKAAAKPPVAAAKATAPKAKAVAAPVVTLKAIFEQLGETHALPKKQADALLTDFLTTITAHLKRGDRIRMRGLGTLEVRNVAARTGHNPATGEAMQIEASKKVASRPAKELKEAI